MVGIGLVSEFTTARYGLVDRADGSGGRITGGRHTSLAHGQLYCTISDHTYNRRMFVAA